MTEHCLAIDPGDVKTKIKGVETKEPAFGLPAIWIPDDMKDDAQFAGYTVVDLPNVITTHISELVRQHAYDFLGRQEVQRLLDNLSKSNPKVVEELVPGLLSLGSVQKVLQNLVREQVSIRDLLTILETLADYAPMVKDADVLTEYVRQRLARSLSKPYVDGKQSLKVLTVTQDIEELMSSGINQTEYGTYLALDPHQASSVMDAVKKGIDRVSVKLEHPVILCSTAVRRHMKNLCERFRVQAAVLSHNEIPSGLDVQSLGEIRLKR